MASDMTADGFYKTRKHQLRATVKDYPNSARKLAMEAALIGAIAERERTLAILRGLGLHQAVNAVMRLSCKDIFDLPHDWKPAPNDLDA